MDFVFLSMLTERRNFGCIVLPVESIWQGNRVWQRTLLLTGKLLFNGEHVIIDNYGHHCWQKTGHNFQILQAKSGEKKKLNKKKKKSVTFFPRVQTKSKAKWRQTQSNRDNFSTSEVTYIRTRRGSLKTWLSIISHAPWPSDSIRSSSIRSGLSWLSTQIIMINIQFTFSCVYCSLWCVLKKITHTQSKVIMKKYTPWSNSGCIYKIKG